MFIKSEMFRTLRRKSPTLVYVLDFGSIKRPFEKICGESSMEMWKESQLKQFTCTRQIETAYPILENFVKNIGLPLLQYQGDINGTGIVVQNLRYQ
jgi:hypothetical protein